MPVDFLVLLTMLQSLGVIIPSIRICVLMLGKNTHELWLKKQVT